MMADANRHRQPPTSRVPPPPAAAQQQALAARQHDHTTAWHNADGAANGAVQKRLGVAWVLVGLASYFTLSLLARAALHSPAGLQQLQHEVPRHVYDRSTFVFGTACLLDVLGLLFEIKSSRLDMVALPAFVKGLATLTNALVRGGWAAVGVGASGRVVLVQRYVCWMHTTPTILVLVKMMAASITRQQAVRAVACVEVMLLTGLAGSLTAGWWAVFWGGLSHLAFLPLLPYLHQGLREASAVVSLHAARPTMAVVYYLTMLMWVGFGLAWDLRLLGLIDLHTEEVANLVCDFAAKVMFSAGLMLSSFKSLDSRREVVMRQIQEEHKQTLILELRRAIEQKDAFMSSVSHELRTPLNGIIGISEGLLANCCGVLSESVRRQLFIVRTSGARLLALINDVMDAATLRQHRLVLKQEKLELRQVVGDVVDLTRSLVDADVTLRNDVPEGLEVWADSGRIIQILNNLLGNAAKFTHQGSIRVSAKWHDEQRQWVCIQVTDTGIGIPKHKLQTIFLPFEQVDGSISRQYGGFGLGLSITQELVKAHGGELWVHSREHKGSQFSITIPSFTGQQPLTLQQQQSMQLQTRRSAVASRTQARLGAAGLLLGSSGGGGEKLQRQRSLPPTSPAAAAAEDGSSQQSVTPRAAAAAAAERALSPAVNGGVLPADLLDEDYYAKELPYDAAQLSALASTKPFAPHPLAAGAAPSSSTTTSTSGHSSSSSSSSGTLQRAGSQRMMRHVGSMLSLTGAVSLEPGGLDITPLPSRDQRPSQFACTGRYQVLSVDDDPVNQTVVQSLLASTGYEVVCLYNGQQTLEYIDSADVLPDLILLDMLMPDMSGPEVLRRLAARVPPLAVPIILVSALAEESSVVQGLDSGADDYITKPFRRAEFLARIRGKLQLATSAGEQASLQGPNSAGSDEPVVMCITDDEVNHIVLEGILQSQGYSYQKVASGAEALRLLDAAGSKPPHLVLLDAALPDTTGLEVLQLLRVRYSQVALPVIMLTARHNEKPIVQVLDAGANDYAVKPFRRSELLARIRMHLRSSQKAAAAASPTPLPGGEPHSGELSLAGDLTDQCLEPQQCSLRLEQLSSVPLLVVQLGGVDEVLAQASAEQACQLMGFIADCFDALVEKYAVLKVEASDTCLTVAAPISVSSCQNSARNSLQLPVLQQPGSSSLQAGDAAPAQQQTAQDAAGAGSAPAASAEAVSAPAVWASRPSGALSAATLQLLQLAQELQAYLGIDPAASRLSSSSTASFTTSAAVNGGGAAAAAPRSTQAAAQQSSAPSDAQPAAAGQQPAAGRPRTPLQLLQAPSAPQWWQGRLHVQVGLHVGPLHGGVVGRRRPRYRLMGAAVEVVRLACMAAPHNCTVATAQAAEFLLSSGVQGLRPFGGLAGGAADAASPQLWLLRAGAGAPAQQQPSLQLLPGSLAASTAAAAGDGITHGVLSQAAAALAATDDAAVAARVSKAAAAGLMHVGSIELTAAAAPTAAAPVWLQQPAATSAPPLQLQQQQAANEQLQSNAATVAASTALLGLSPAVPPLLVDSAALQHNQQLLLHELSLFAQHLAAASSAVSPATTTAAAMQGCNGLLSATPVPATAPVAEPVSGALSLQEWHDSPASRPAQPQPGDTSTAPLQDADSGWCHELQLQQQQLGPTELQQVSLLQQELAALQQQLSSTLACTPPSNGSNGMAKQQSAVRCEEQGGGPSGPCSMRSSSTDSSSAAVVSHPPRQGGQRQPAIATAPPSKSGPRRQSGASLLGVFRRRSGKKGAQQPQQQPGQEHTGQQ